MRQVLIDAFQLALYERLANSADQRLAAIAAKAVKEIRYHLRYSSSWLVRSGDGTCGEPRAGAVLARPRCGATRSSSSRRMSSIATWRRAASRRDLAEVRAAWSARIDEILAEATLERPRDLPYSWFGKRGEHSEHLGYILAEMQYLQRAYPGAQW